jgi:hypothetical protein
MNPTFDYLRINQIMVNHEVIHQVIRVFRIRRGVTPTTT